MNQYIYKHFKIFLGLFTFIALTSVTQFWYISLLSISFFLWNLFNEKRNLAFVIVLLILTFFLLVFNHKVLMPTNKWGEKVRAEWNKIGYDPSRVEAAQEKINVLNKLIERYRDTYAFYPNSLNDLGEIYLLETDNSYRMMQTDGQTGGIPFHYQKIGLDKFHLAGVGEDGIIFTRDDMFPQISKTQEETTGLTDYSLKSFTYEEMESEMKLLRMHDRVTEINARFKNIN